MRSSSIFLAAQASIHPHTVPFSDDGREELRTTVWQGNSVVSFWLKRRARAAGGDHAPRKAHRLRLLRREPSPAPPALPVRPVPEGQQKSLDCLPSRRAYRA